MGYTHVRSGRVAFPRTKLKLAAEDAREAPAPVRRAERAAAPLVRKSVADIIVVVFSLSFLIEIQVTRNLCCGSD